MSVKISELPILDSLADNDVIAGVDTSANVTSKIEMATLKNYIDTNTQYTAGTNIDITNNVVSAPNVYNKTETDGLIDDLETNINEQLEEKDEQIEELQSEVDSLSTIFNAFPTESGEGESLTLDDTAEVKFKKFDLKGNTSQTTYSGKNLLNNNLLTTTVTKNGITATPHSDGSITFNGTATTLSFFNLSQQDFGENGFNSETGGAGLYVATDGGTLRMAYDPSNHYTYIQVNNGASLNNVILYPMIRLKTITDDTYEPYVGGTTSPNPSYPQPVNVVSGDNEINVVGKNLLDTIQPDVVNFTSNWQKSAMSLNNNLVLKAGSYTMSLDIKSASGKVFNKISFIDVDNNEYTWTIYVAIPTTYTSYSHTFTFNNDIVVKRIDYQNGGDGSETFYLNNIQLEKGSSATAYEPYQGNTYNIDLPVENLFDKDNANYVNGWIDGTTMRLNTTNGNRLFYIPCKPNTTYTISRSVITSSFRTTTYDSTPFPTATGSNVDYTVGSVLKNDNGKTLTITTNANAKYLVVHYGKIEDTNLNETLASIQVEYGSKANSYTPYGTTPIELCKIGNYQDYFAKSDGTNLFDKDNANVLNAYISTNLSVITANENNRTTYMKCKPNTTYTVSKLLGKIFAVAYTTTTPNIGVEFYGIVTGGTGDGDGTTRSKATITTGANASYLVIRYTNITQDTTITETEMLNSIQVEESSTASLWQPYGVGKWYLHKEIEKVVFNGSEDWTKTSDTSASVFVTAILGRNTSLSSSSLSNYFKYQFANVEGKFYFGSSSSNNCAFCMATTYTLESFKTWLSTNNPFVYYVLATPTNTEITYQPLIDQLNLLEKAMSKDGQTNISQVSNDKPFILDVTAIKSLQNILDRIELLES